MPGYQEQENGRADMIKTSLVSQILEICITEQASLSTCVKDVERTRSVRRTSGRSRLTMRMQKVYEIVP